MKDILVVQKLKKVYPATPPVTALAGIDLVVRRGEVTALLGPNGAGKTTLVKIICGLVRPTEGEVWVNGKALSRYRHKLLRHLTAVLEGDRNLRFRLTGLENIQLYLALGGFPFPKSRVLPLAERFGLAEVLHRQVRFYSKGMKQKLSLLIAFLTDADVILLDEPTLGLDVHSSLELQRFIRELSQQGRAVLLTTHEMHVAQKVADRVAILHQGRLIAYQPLKELLEMFRYTHYTLRLRPNSPSKGEALERKLKGLPQASLSWEGDDLLVNLANADSSSLLHLLDLLREAEVEILEVARKQPDLEQVYLQIVEKRGSLCPSGTR